VAAKNLCWIYCESTFPYDYAIRAAALAEFNLDQFRQYERGDMDLCFRVPRERATMAAVLFASVAINWGCHFTAANLDHAPSLADQVVLTLFFWSAV
jgi:hypothetical protein